MHGTIYVPIHNVSTAAQLLLISAGLSAGLSAVLRLNQRSQFVLTSFSFVYSLNADAKEGNAYTTQAKR